MKNLYGTSAVNKYKNQYTNILNKELDSDDSYVIKYL